MKSSLRNTGFALAFCMAPALAYAERGNESVLKGDYAFSGEATCLVSPAGFNANLTPVAAPAPFPFMVTFSINGVRRFHGDGNGVVEARLLSIRHPRALPATPARPDPLFERGSVAEVEMTADFTYAVGADGGLSISNPTVPSVFLLPEQPGNGNAPGPDTLLATGVAEFVGAVSADHKTLEVTQQPGVEKHVAQRWNGSEFVEQVDFRVCHRSRVLLRLNGG